MAEGETIERQQSNLRVGLVQMCSSIDPAVNMATSTALISEAAQDGAQIIATPEMTNLLDLKFKRMVEHLHLEDDDPSLASYRNLAAKLGCWLAIGSMPILLENDKVANRSFMINASGDIVARYDKAHMFDVDLANGESYRESRSYQAGEQAVLINSPMAKLGLSVCYDVRFPYLYRTLAQAGADVIFVPAAFTQKTGEAHWHTLLKARAIECGCYIVAAAQSGQHEDGRMTFGHSLVVDPWGQVLADLETGPGYLTLDISLNNVDTARQNIPSLKHDRALVLSQIDS